MKKFIAEEFDPAMCSLANSYCYLRKDFAEIYEELQQQDLLREDGTAQMLWSTHTKFVIKVPLPDGRFAAYKTYRRIDKPLKFALRPSPCGFEAINFQQIRACGIPAVELLAVGDERRFFKLKNAFIATLFADGFENGRDFIRDGVMAKESALLEEFIVRNMQYLARLHDIKIMHRGFTPANLLYRVRESADDMNNLLDIKWIDVASCRRLSAWSINRNIADDMVQFFRFFDFDGEKLLKYLQVYCNAREKSAPPPEKILKKLEKLLAERKKRKNSRHK